mgnify:CR=1 FL=1
MVSLKNAFQKLSDSIEQQLPMFNAPGVAIGITNREEILHASLHGLANQEAGKRVTPETLFQIGSISKSFTSILLLQLQEQGLLNINEPVKTYLPWFEIRSEYAPITLRHLMSHTAGIIMGSDETTSAYTETWNLGHTKTTAAPGEYFHYSNSGYKVLGVVLESILEQNFGDILQERILSPLGMTKTTPVIRNADRARMAVGYNPFYDDRPLPAGGLLAPATWLESDTADGSICSTAEDMCIYLRSLLQNGVGLLAPQSFEQMIASVVATDDGLHGEHYGLGLFTQVINGRRIIGHSGGMVGYTADMLADMDSGLGVIVLTNGPADPQKISRYALDLLHAALQGDDLPDFPPDGMKQDDASLGHYSSGKKSFELRMEDGRLALGFGSATVSLEKRSPDVFLVPHPDFDLFPLRLERENDEGTGVSYGGERFAREGYPQKAASPYPREWEAYPGHYRSHNPWFSNFRVVLRDGLLVFIEPNGDEEELHHLEFGLFRIGAEVSSPESVRFDVILDGKAMRAILSGGTYSRTFTP